MRFILQLPPRQAVNPLFSMLCHREPLVRWRAVTAMGVVVAGLAKEDRQSAREVIRRMIWQLNDESGGIGWGVPECMGETLARDHGLACEYHRILISYLQEEGNFMEFGPLQRGVLWGLGRLAQCRPELVSAAIPALRPFLGSTDPEHRGLAAWALGLVGDRGSTAALSRLLHDHTDISFYHDWLLGQTKVGILAKQALAQIAQDGRQPARLVVECPTPEMVALPFGNPVDKGPNPGGENCFLSQKETSMDLKTYFSTVKGRGVLATADAAGRVDAAIYATPHFLDDGTVAFIMRDRLTHANLQSNPHAVYLFMELDNRNQGKRLFLTKTGEEKDSPLLQELSRRQYPADRKEARYLVSFRIDKVLPLIGAGEQD